MQRIVTIIVPSIVRTIVATVKGWFRGKEGVMGEYGVLQVQTGHSVHLCIIVLVQLARKHGIWQSRSAGFL